VLRVWLTGDWTAQQELAAALAERDELALVDADAAEVAIHVTGPSLADELAQLREHAQAPVLLLAAAPAEGLLEADAAEVLILPQSADAVAFAAHKAAAAAVRPRASSRALTTTVFSPKGGTGKSVVACNLAVALAESGKRTLLVDLDLQFGDVAIMLGLEPERTLHDLLTAPGSLDAEKIAGYATRHGSTLDVLPAPLKPEDAESITDERVGELLDAARAGYDAVVVDTAPFFHGTVLAALDRTDDLLLLCAPDVPTMKNVRLALQTLELLSFPQERVRLALNRANARVGFRAAQVSSVLEREVELELPEDEAAAIGVNRGTPAVVFKSQSPFAVAIRGVVERLERRDAPAKSHRRRFALGRRA
jgi:pilus assembly protein CpaE